MAYNHEPWPCGTCTFLNNALLPRCEMCNTARVLAQDPPRQRRRQSEFANPALGRVNSASLRRSDSLLPDDLEISAVAPESTATNPTSARRSFSLLSRRFVADIIRPSSTEEDRRAEEERRLAEEARAEERRLAAEAKEEEELGVKERAKGLVLGFSDLRWVNDGMRQSCAVCSEPFSFTHRRRHHCRECGEVVCSDCSAHEQINITNRNPDPAESILGGGAEETAVTSVKKSKIATLRICRACRPETRPQPGEMVACGICYEEFDRAEAPLRCGHAFCSECVAGLVNSNINSGEEGVRKMVCPDPDCNHVISRRLIASLTTARQLKKFDEHHNACDPSVTLCPRPGCDGAGRTGNSRRFHCSECDETSCTKCGGDYHHLPICDDDSHVKNWQQGADAKQCPWCSHMIEKNGGCKHMTCRHCGYQFCWTCFQPWKTHVDPLCFKPNPFRIANSTNPNWGPVAPVRMITKTAAATASTGIIIGIAGTAAGIVAAGAATVCAGYVVFVLPYKGVQHAMK